MTELQNILGNDDKAFLKSLNAEMERHAADGVRRSRFAEWAIDTLAGLAVAMGGYLPLEGKSTDPNDDI